jgi:hypothetical protein
MNDSLEAYYQTAAEAMARDIDREVLWGMLTQIGWTRVILSGEVARNNAEDIVQWLKVNCKHPYEKSMTDFLFENEKDANWFILRWLTPYGTSTQY